jgi:hypothetical protein
VGEILLPAHKDQDRERRGHGAAVNKQPARVRAELHDGVFQDLCSLPTIKGRVTDTAQLCRDLACIIDDHWFLDTVTKAVPWRSLMETPAAMWAASDDVQAVRDRLQAASDPSSGAKPDLVEAEARRFAAARRKLDSARDRVARSFSFINRIDPKEQDRVMEAVLGALIDGFGKQSQVLRGANDYLTPPSWIPEAMRGPLNTEMHRAIALLQRKANLSERIGAIVFNAPSDDLNDRVLKEYGLAVGRLPPRDAGRPRGIKKHLECRFFVHDLLIAVANAGGELRFDKNAKRGTLLDALRLLAPFLPPPATCSFATSEELPPGLPGLLAEILSASRT